MAEHPEENIIQPIEQHVQATDRYPQQATETDDNHLSEKSKFRRYLSDQIRGRAEDISELDGLLPELQANVLEQKDERGFDVLCECIHAKNPLLLCKVIELLRKLSLHSLIHDTKDLDYNNCLQLVLLSKDPLLLDTFWKSVHGLLSEHQVTCMITHKNSAEQNAITLALELDFCHASKWIKGVFAHEERFSAENIKALWDTDWCGVCSISRAVQIGYLDIASHLLKLVFKLCKDQLDPIFRTQLLVIKEQSGNNDAHDTGTGQIEIRTSLFELVFSLDLNESEIKQVLECYVIDMYEYTHINSREANRHFGRLVAPIREGAKSPLSLLIEHDCLSIIGRLLYTAKFRVKFLKEVGTPNGIFDKSKLESNKMSGEMVALFNEMPIDTFLNLTDHSVAKPQAMLFFTEDHTEASQQNKRHGATEECKDFEAALQEISFNCQVFSGHKTCWTRNDLLQWLENRIKTLRDTTSMLMLAGFTHGREGYLYDSHGEPIEIREIVQLANKLSYTGIPIVFMFQACRGSPGPKSPPPGLKKYNVLIRTTSEGEQSIRKLYFDKFAEVIRASKKDIYKIHKEVVKFFRCHADANIKKQSPEFMDEMFKDKLLLP